MNSSVLSNGSIPVGGGGDRREKKQATTHQRRGSFQIVGHTLNFNEGNGNNFGSPSQKFGPLFDTDFDTMPFASSNSNQSGPTHFNNQNNSVGDLSRGLRTATTKNLNFTQNMSNHIISSPNTLYLNQMAPSGKRFQRDTQQQQPTWDDAIKKSASPQSKHQLRHNHAKRIQHLILSTPTKTNQQQRKIPSHIYNTPQKFGTKKFQKKNLTRKPPRSPQQHVMVSKGKKIESPHVLSVSGMPLLHPRRRCSTSQDLHMEESIPHKESLARNHAHHVFINHVKPSTSYVRGGGYHSNMRTNASSNNSTNNTTNNNATIMRHHDELSIAPMKRFSEPVNVLHRRPTTPQQEPPTYDSCSEIDEELSEVVSLSSYLSRTSSSCESALRSNDMISIDAIHRFKSSRRVSTPDAPFDTNQLEDLYDLYIAEDSYLACTPSTEDEEFPDEVFSQATS